MSAKHVVAKDQSSLARGERNCYRKAIADPEHDTPVEFGPAFSRRRGRLELAQFAPVRGLRRHFLPSHSSADTMK
jgi:hypothetical protein